MLSHFFLRGESEEVVVLCHGFLGDKRQRGMFDVIAKELNKASYNVFSFDFRGCGDNPSESISVEKQLEDLEEVLNYLSSKGFGSFILVGYSLGGYICLRKWKKAKALVLIAPVTSSLPIRENFAKRNRYAKVEGGWVVVYDDRKYFVEDSFADTIESIDQEELLKCIDVKALFIQGSEDKAIPLEHTKRAADKLGAELFILEGAGHLLNPEESRIAAKRVVSFLEGI